MMCRTAFLLTLLFIIPPVIMAQKPPLRHDTQEKTIAKCLDDLKSDSLERRRRAAMLIGKYDTPEALDALVKCLSDPDSAVRQSALVSLTEDRSLPAQARMWVFRLLRDPDVHIRRLASSMIPEAVGVSIRGISAFAPGIHIRASGGRSPTEDAEAIDCMNAALADPDPSVRRNVLAGARFFPKPLERTRLEGFLVDPDAEVRALALASYANLVGNVKKRAAALEPMLSDPSPKVRIMLVETAASLGADGTALLRTLTGDADPDVSLAAVSAFARQLHEEGFNALQAKLLDTSVPTPKRAKLCYLLRLYPDNARPLLLKLAEDPAGAIRAEAVRLLATGNFGDMNISFFLDAIKSDNPDVRRQAAFSVRRNLTKPSPAQIQQLFLSEYPDIRALAVELLRKCPRSQAPTPEIDNLLLDACLDDSLDVRSSALKILPQLKPEGWMDILLNSLKDDSPQIAEAAAAALCFTIPTEATQKALAEYLPSCKSVFLVRRLSSYIKRRPIPVRQPRIQGRKRQ